MNYIKSLSGNTKGMVLYGRVKEELIRRGVMRCMRKQWSGDNEIRTAVKVIFI
jgi:hypothetical protein